MSESSYSVSIRPLAQRHLARLDRDVLTRIDRKITALARDPRPHGCTKLTGYASVYRVRVGAYRIVYEIDDRLRSVDVLFVAHRREVYRDF